MDMTKSEKKKPEKKKEFVDFFDMMSLEKGCDLGRT